MPWANADIRGRYGEKKVKPVAYSLITVDFVGGRVSGRPSAVDQPVAEELLPDAAVRLTALPVGGVTVAAVLL